MRLAVCTECTADTYQHHGIIGRNHQTEQADDVRVFDRVENAHRLRETIQINIEVKFLRCHRHLDTPHRNRRVRHPRDTHRFIGFDPVVSFEDYEKHTRAYFLSLARSSRLPMPNVPSPIRSIN